MALAGVELETLVSDTDALTTRTHHAEPLSCLPITCNSTHP